MKQFMGAGAGREAVSRYAVRVYVNYKIVQKNRQRLEFQPPPAQRKGDQLKPLESQVRDSEPSKHFDH